MQRILLLVSLMVSISYCGLSQSLIASCSKTPFNCGANLSREQFNTAQIITVANLSYARFSAKSPDVNYYDPDNGDFNDCGVDAPDCRFDGASLTYDVYYPSTTAYPCYQTQPLPAIFLFPGSGFSDCVSDDENTADYCLEFAKRGFVAFNVNYRKGRLKDPTGALTASQILAMYRAFQDGRGAIRTVIAQNNFHEYKIDTANIFIGGMSAGGEIALNIGYSFSEAMNEQIFPGVAEVLGPIDAEFYKGSPQINFTVKGVLNLWGAAFLPSSVSPAASISQNTNNPPLIAFHGEQDPTLWTTSVKVPLSNKKPYNYESACLLPGSNKQPQVFVIPKDENSLIQCGSSALYDTFTKSDSTIPSEVYLDSDMGHGLGPKSDFGFGNGKISKADLKVYIVGRAATFFQTAINKRVRYLKTTHFENCVNYRVRACKKDELSDNFSCASTRAASFTETPAFAESASPNLFTVSEYRKHIYLHFEDNANGTVYLYSINGNMVKKSNINSTNEVLDCSGLSSGIYMITIVKGAQIEKAKIVLR